MTNKLKIEVGEEGWGILSVGRIQLAFDLETAGGRKKNINKIYIYIFYGFL